MPRLVYITTAGVALRNLVEGQLSYFREQGYEVYGVASPGDDLNIVGQREQVEVVGVPMEREIRLGADLVSLWRLWRLMRRLRPDVVTAGTAKAGLLGMLAAWLARVPVRVYQLWGLRLETTTGFKRRLLNLTEQITSACSQRIICVSGSLRQSFIDCGSAKPEKTVMLLHGSCNGIDAQKYVQTEASREAGQQLRAKWNVPPDAPVIGFVGRFVRDKGIVELVDAFDQILARRPDAWLLLVGDYESGDPVPEEYRRRIDQHPRIIRPGFIQNLPPYYAAITVMAFPTYREGFPTVVLEAGAAELPVVAFRATGAVDAVEDGVTGLIVPLGDRQALAEGLLRYLNDPELCRQQGAAAKARVFRDFRREPLWAAMNAEFQDLLSRMGR
ncbi:MAG TPA: glycosyltransferase family 4 protein [Pirellulales bacterium]|jgi:glycosyltransferase involved in cell wall biosynthesis